MLRRFSLPIATVRPNRIRVKPQNLSRVPLPINRRVPRPEKVRPQIDLWLPAKIETTTPLSLSFEEPWGSFRFTEQRVPL
jgi:hypothetical protein